MRPIVQYKEPVSIPVAKFDWKTNSKIKQTVEIDSNSMILFEGVFLFRPELNNFWGYKIFIDIDFQTSLERGLQRDSELLGGVEATREKYLQRYIPGQKIYLSTVCPKEKAN